MLLIAATWALLLVLVVLLGTGTYAFYIKILGPRYETRPSLFQFAWLGYASLIGFIQIYSLFFPVNEQAVLAAFSLALVGCFFSYRHLIQCCQQFFDIPLKLKVIATVVFAIIVTLLSYNSTLLPMHYDTQLYGLNTVKWTNSYPAVPGIVNLHGRLAFNSSFLVFAALTNTWIWKDGAVYIANGFLLLLVTVQWFAHIATIPLRGRRMADAFVVFTFPLLITTAFHLYFPSLSTDMPLYILSLVIVLELLSIRSNSALRWYDAMNRKNLFSWFLMVSLAAVVFSTKLGGVPFLLILAPVSLILLIRFSRKTCSRYISPRHLAVMYGLPVIVISGLIARYIILSGWLIYPVPVGNLHLDWSASPEQVANMLNVIMSCARTAFSRPEEVLGRGISYWITPWCTEFKRNYPALILLSSGIVGLLYTAFAQPARALKPAKSFPLYLSIAIGVTGLVYWFISAPDYRFGEIYFWIFAATALTAPFLLLFNFHIRGYVIVLLTMTPLMWGLKYFRGEILQPFPDPPRFVSIPPAMGPKGMLTQVTVKNGQSPPLIVYRPIGEEHCGNSPLPCSPYIEENSTIELRIPGELKSGFRPTGIRTPDMPK